jgi:surface polysaccharide O-acyltransferase-like enzyme
MLLAPGYFSGGLKNIRDYTCVDFFNIFWSVNNGSPILYPFWFLRDLMIMVVFSPLIGLLLKRGSWLVIVLFFIYFIESKYNVPLVVSSVALFWFSLGGYIVRLDLSKILDRIRRYWPALAVLGLVLTTVDALLQSYGVNGLWYGAIHIFTLATNMILFFVILDYIRENKGLGQAWLMKLSDAAFIIYAAHEPFIWGLRKLAVKYVGASLFVYWGLLITALFYSIIIYYILKRLPRTFAVLTGGRISYKTATKTDTGEIVRTLS